MSTATQITWESISPLLKDKYWLYYVDRGDSLDDMLSNVQMEIRDPELCYLWEAIMQNWWPDLESEKADLLKAMTDTFDIDHDEASDLWDEHEDRIRDEIHDRDASTPISDLLRNTSNQAMYYSSGVYMDDYSSGEERLDVLKRALRIEEDSHDRQLQIMLSQVAYGGELVIYFYGDLADWVSTERHKGNMICFDGCYIAVVDEINGSGDHMWYGGKVWLTFNRENLTICRTVNYSYTHRVCGMVNSWCDDTRFEIVEEILVPKWGYIS